MKADICVYISCLLSRARLSLGRENVIQSLYLFYVDVPYVCFHCLLFPLWLTEIIKNKGLSDRLCQPSQPSAQHLSCWLFKRNTDRELSYLSHSKQSKEK